MTSKVIAKTKHPRNVWDSHTNRGVPAFLKKGTADRWESQIARKIYQAQGIRQEFVPHASKSAKSTSFLHFKKNGYLSRDNPKN